MRLGVFVRVQTCAELALLAAAVAVGQNKLCVSIFMLQFYFCFTSAIVMNWSLLQVLLTLLQTSFILFKLSRLVCEHSLHVYLQYYNKCMRQY